MITDTLVVLYNIAVYNTNPAPLDIIRYRFRRYVEVAVAVSQVMVAHLTRGSPHMIFVTRLNIITALIAQHSRDTRANEYWADSYR